jgi:hypothetical protein
MYHLIALQAICFMICLLSIYDSPEENKVFAVIASLVPGLGYLLALFAVWDIIRRTIKSKGKCLWGHD